MSVLVVATLGCGRETKTIECIDLNASLDSIAEEALTDNLKKVRFPFCQIAPEGWDQVAIISPYIMEKDIDDLKLKNIGDIDEELDAIHLQEGKCALIFSKERQIIAYSIVNRTPVDFVTLIKISTSKGLKHIYDSTMCDKLELNDVFSDEVILSLKK